MIRNGLCPEHIDKDVFLSLYEGYYEERKKYNKEQPENYIYKILLNATYGLTNDEFSFLKDQQVTLAICINGQLLLTQLLEMLSVIPECKLIMMNTDGFEVIIPRQHEQKYYEICKQWEQLTKLELEFADYSKMIISDVNNYIAIFTNGKTKTKGKYEFENIPLHKNKSHNIIPIAVFNYWVNNIPVEETIKNHSNIFDFCAGVRATKTPKGGKVRFELWKVDEDTIKKTKLSKTVRYYICKENHDGYLMKVYENGSYEKVEAPSSKGKIKKEWKVKYFNKYFESNNYNIDYQYYIIKANEMINKFIEKPQLF